MKQLRVLFVCIGNSCRSQMAEGFANRYGADVLAAQSAGLAPAEIIVPRTYAAMEEKNINLDGHFPKSIDIFNVRKFDLLVNISGRKLPKGKAANTVAWDVPDPIGMGPEEFREVRDDLERRVMRLILEERMKRSSPGR